MLGILYSLLDDKFAAWLKAQANPTLTSWMRTITVLGSPPVILVMALVLVGLLLYWREKLIATQVGLCVFFGILLNTILKFIFERSRPNLEPAIVHAAGFSFPSGHTAAATLFFSVVAYVACRKLEPLPARVAVVAASFLLVQLVAVSRIYLGVHYFTDVITAQLISFLWVMISLSIIDQVHRRRYTLPRTTRAPGKP